jgi:hypothetical protein
VDERSSSVGKNGVKEVRYDRSKLGVYNFGGATGIAAGNGLRIQYNHAVVGSLDAIDIHRIHACCRGDARDYCIRLIPEENSIERHAGASPANGISPKRGQ